MDKSGRKTSEMAVGSVIAVFLSLKDKLGIDYMEPEVIQAITWIAVAYILGRSAVKVAATFRNGG